MSLLATAGAAGYAPATTSAASFLPGLVRRARWALPMIAWNCGLFYLNTIAHSPVLVAVAGGSVAVALIVAVSEPDDIED
jgi:hypothetical protein